MAKDFFSFLKRPTRRHPRPVAVKTHAGAIFTLLALNLLFTLLVCAPVMLVLNRTIGLDINPFMQTGAFMFSAVVIAPFTEELMFRAGLRSASWTLFGMPAMSALFLPSTRIGVGLAVLLGIVWLLDRRHRRRLTGEALARLRRQRGRLFIRNYGLVVYLFASLFAAAHFANFVLDAGIGWKSAFLVFAVMSQLMNGLVFCYLRLRYGLTSSMLAHLSWNAVTVGINLLAS